jgi:hypothetical protein
VFDADAHSNGELHFGGRRTGDLRCHKAELKRQRCVVSIPVEKVARIPVEKVATQNG